jgi:hypothetical protein
MLTGARRFTLAGQPRAYNSNMPSFMHRQNADGSWDSICRNCYLTVIAGANVRSESELSDTEAIHIGHVSIWDDDNYRHRSN